MATELRATVIDWDEALEYVEGDEEFLREMLAEFANEAQGHVDSLQTAVAEGNAESIKFSAHSIKGSAATLQVKIVRDIAKALESLAAATIDGRLDRAQFVANLDPNLQELIAAWQQFKAWLREDGIMA